MKVEKIKIKNYSTLLDTQEISKILHIVQNSYSNIYYDIYVFKSIGDVFKYKGINSFHMVKKWLELSTSNTFQKNINFSGLCCVKTNEIYIFEDKIFNHIFKHISSADLFCEEKDDTKEVITNEWAKQLMVYSLLHELSHANQGEKYLKRSNEWSDNNAEAKVRRIYKEYGKDIRRILDCRYIKIDLDDKPFTFIINLNI